MKVGDIVKLRSSNSRTIGIIVNIGKNRCSPYQSVKIGLSNGVIRFYRESQLMVLNKNNNTIV